MEPFEQAPTAETEEPPSAPSPEPVVWTPGQIHHLGPFEVPGHAPRMVRVYLPRAFTPEVPRYALYLFDGQNVFDDEPSFSGGWHAHEAVEKLGQRRLHPIVVGIDHGGESRIRELSPFPYQDQPGEVDSFLEWIIGTLMPTLAADLPLIPGPVGAVAGGSSMGGLASFYAHFKRPDAFGGALVMSPSFWLEDAGILRWVAEQPLPEVSRVYLDCGGREGKGTLLPLVASMAAHLANRGYDSDRLMFRCDSRGAHSERDWRRRLLKALRFFYR